MANKPNVLMILPEMNLGGVARTVCQLSERLASDCRVTLLPLNNSTVQPVTTNCEVLPLSKQGGGTLVQRLSRWLRRVAMIRQIKRNLAIDLTISHNLGAHYLDFASNVGEANIFCAHGTISHDGDGSCFDAVMRRTGMIQKIYRHADAVVGVGNGVVEELVQLGAPPNRALPINNLIDASAISRAAGEPLRPEEAALFDGPPVIASVGRLENEKNHVELLEAFSILRRSHQARLIIIGGGKLLQSLCEYGTSLGFRVCALEPGETPLPDCDIYFLGWQSNPFKFLTRSQLFAFPSLCEGFGLAIAEAMVCGVPVLSADCPFGPREILSGERASPQPLTEAQFTECGVLLPMLTSDTDVIAARRVWATTIANLIDEPGERERLSRAARERVQDFNPRTITSQWLELIDHVMANGRRIGPLECSR